MPFLFDDLGIHSYLNVIPETVRGSKRNQISNQDLENEMTKYEKFDLLADKAGEFEAVHPLIDDNNDLVAVQPLPLGPVMASDDTSDAVEVRPFPLGPVDASEDGGGLVAVQPLPLGPVPALVESTNTLATASMATTDTTGLHAGVFTDYEWNVLTKAGVDLDDVPADLVSGPTLSEYNGGGDFEALADGEVLVKTNKHLTAAFYNDQMLITSDGLLVTDSDQLIINAEDEGHTVYWHEGGTHLTNHHYYTAIDASNADGYVTYQGVTKERWVGETQLTSKHYEFENVFKGGDYGNKIIGGNNGDTLIGGAGDDIIKATGGDGNLLFGVGGDNRLIGGSGNDTFFGGTGNDFINTGTGNNTVVLQAGDNIVIAPQNSIEDGSTNTYANKIVAGSGNDTFVIGNIPAAVTSVEGFGYNGVDILESAGESVASKVIEVGLDAVALNPIVGFMTTGVLSMLESLVGGTPADVVDVTEWGEYHVSHIYSFNPVSDRLVLPMNPDGDYNLQFVPATSLSDSYAFQVVDKHGDPTSDHSVWSTMLEVDYASGKAIFGDWHSDALSLDEIKAFNESLMANTFTMDGDHVSYAGQEVGSSALENLTGLSLSDELGTSRFALAGAWSGYFIQGGIDSDYIMGTNHSDALFGYDVTNNLNPSSGGGKTYFGFDGDNLFGPSFADNTILGGSGNNTITYQYFSSEKIGDSSDGSDVYIEVNLSETYSSTTYGSTYDDYYQIFTHGGSTVHIDKVFQVQNVVGSQGNDILIGSNQDNTFYSTGGDNTWTGTGGDNIFELTGGSSTITDFTLGSDTILIHKDAYVDASANFRANLQWVEGDDDWTLYNSAGEDAQALVILEKGDGFDGPVEIELYLPSGETNTFTPDMSTSVDLGIDLIV